MNIPFHILLGEPDKVLPDFIKSKEIGGVVTDFTPMRTPLKWLENVAKKLPTSVPVCQVLIVFNINMWLHVVHSTGLIVRVQAVTGNCLTCQFSTRSTCINYPV